MEEELDEYGQKLMAIDDRVYSLLGEAMLVDFSAYPIDSAGNPVDNLDEVPIEGKVIFVRPKDSWAQAMYMSPLLTSPTWLEICRVANEMIRYTGDEHHCFLEAVKVVSTDEKGVQLAHFSMGS